VPSNAQIRKDLRLHQPIDWKGLCRAEEILVAGPVEEMNPLRSRTLVDMGYLCNLLLSWDLPLAPAVERLEDVIENQEFLQLPIDDVYELVRQVLRDTHRVLNEHRDRLRRQQRSLGAK